MTSQKDLILQHLYSIDDKGKRRGITLMEALGLYRVISLSSRICELKTDGYKFISQRKRDLTGKAYVRYFLVSK